MRDGVHVDTTNIDELSALQILRELHDEASRENDGKVHVREIENGHIGRTIEKF